MNKIDAEMLELLEHHFWATSAQIVLRYRKRHEKLIASGVVAVAMNRLQEKGYVAFLDKDVEGRATRFYRRVERRV